MSIKIRCACGNVLYAPEERIGEVGRCPTCNRQIRVKKTESSEEKVEDVPIFSHKHPKNNKRLGIVVILSNICIYSFFAILLCFFLLLHMLPDKKISSFTWWNVAQLQKFWDENEQWLLMSKEKQRNWFESWGSEDSIPIVTPIIPTQELPPQSREMPQQIPNFSKPKKEKPI